MKTEAKTVDDYIKNFPVDVQTILEKMRQTIRKAAPDTVESISYHMSAFKLNGKGLVYFAAFERHIGFYPDTLRHRGFQEGAVAVQAGQGLGAVPAR